MDDEAGDPRTTGPGRASGGRATPRSSRTTNPTKKAPTMNAHLASILAVTARMTRESLALKSGGRRRITARIVFGAPERVAAIVDERARWIERPSARVVFSGGKTGEHSIDAYASDAARVIAHWTGYVEASGLLAPAVGERVAFPSASASRCGGYRTGLVLSVGPKRVKLAFTYKHGGKATTTIAIDRIRFGS